MSLEQARRKTALQAAPVYCFRFDGQTLILEGRPMAFHCPELAFAFTGCQKMTGDGPRARDLVARIGNAEIHFDRSGTRITQAFRSGNHSIGRHRQVFDDECGFCEHLDDDMQKVMNEG